MRRPNHASRFEGIAKTNLQASRASDTETLQSQVNKAAEKRLSLSGLEILHGRLPRALTARTSGLANGRQAYSRRQLLANAAIAASRVGSNFGARPLSVASLGPLGKRLGRYVPRRIVRRRHLSASVKCRMDARH